MSSLIFERENRERIQAVENSFGTSGRPLLREGRILVGEGRLKKQGRKKPQQKDFFLFNDILVYGSIILNGHWHKKQKILPLEDIQLEDMEDGLTMSNQWLLRTPRKSFFVSAPSLDEKQAWMNNIKDWQSSLLQDSSRQPGKIFASSWIPDQAAYKCMRCLETFTTTKRRHHCRRCGFLVCNSCSKQRAVISNIHPTKKLRVCRLCHLSLNKEETSRLSGHWTGRSSEEDSDEDEAEKVMQNNGQSSFLDPGMRKWRQMSIYDYPKPMNLRP